MGGGTTMEGGRRSRRDVAGDAERGMPLPLGA